MEIWKDVKGYEGLYQVSNKGNVKSVPRVVLTILNARHYKTVYLQAVHNDKGYLIVSLSRNGEIKKARVHRLVAEAFIPNEDNKPCIDHINGIRDDNRVENLRWCTKKENCNFELAKQNHIDSHKEQKNENLMKIVHQFTLDGDFVAEFKSTKEAAKAVGCSDRAISKSCREGNPTLGYIWKYKKEDDI